MPKCECKGCLKRKPGCHGVCESYIAYHEWWEAKRKENQAGVTAFQVHKASFRVKDGKTVRRK